MLALESIAWEQVTHAYGYAHDLPTKLGALRSPSRYEREEALTWCYEALWHHGTVYEASALSIPFLLEMLQDPGVQEKEQILLLLAHLATGESCPNAYSIPHHRRMDLTFPGSEEMPPLQTAWLQRTHDAARQGIPLIARCLDAPEMALRVHAAFLLACFPLEGQKIADLLCKRLHNEDDASVKASILLSLGVLELDEMPITTMLDEYLDAAYPALIRLAAAISLTRLHPQSPPHNALRILMHALTVTEISDLYATLPWAEQDIACDVSRLLCQFDHSVADFVLPRLLDVLPLVDPYSAVQVASTLLELSGIEAHRQRRAFSPIQQEILQALVENRSIWMLSNAIASILETFALPPDRASLRAFLHQPPRLHIAAS